MKCLSKLCNQIRKALNLLTTGYLAASARCSAIWAPNLHFIHLISEDAISSELNKLICPQASWTH